MTLISAASFYMAQVHPEIIIVHPHGTAKHAEQDRTCKSCMKGKAGISAYIYELELILAGNLDEEIPPPPPRLAIIILYTKKSEYVHHLCYSLDHSKFTLISLFSKIHSLKSEHIHSFLVREYHPGPFDNLSGPAMPPPPPGGGGVSSAPCLAVVLLGRLKLILIMFLRVLLCHNVPRLPPPPPPAKYGLHP